MPNALDVIEGKESGGRNVYQQIVPREVSSASGHFQMIKPTWQRWAKGAGVDISQYPEAINAPYDVQRQVAAYGFQKEGFKPWSATKDLVGQEANYSTGGTTTPPAGALATDGTAPSPSRPSAYQTAQGFIGQNETVNTAQLAKFMGDNGIPITPQTVPWCAAFVNASIKASGGEGTGSLAARSFMKWGQATDAPNEGDVAVFSRGNDPSKGHVGFYGGRETRDGQDYIKVLAGNQGGASAGGGGVNYAYLPASQLLGFRTSGQAPPSVTNATGTPAAPAGGTTPTAEPSVTTYDTPDEAFQKGLAEVQAKQPKPAPPPVQQAAAPAPAPAAPAQGQAADLMSSLLALKRSRYSQQPPGVLDTSWV